MLKIRSQPVLRIKSPPLHPMLANHIRRSPPPIGNKPPPRVFQQAVDRDAGLGFCGHGQIAFSRFLSNTHQIPKPL
jgi:hypothetical protein